MHTNGAGDVHVGTFVAALARGLDPVAATRDANAAAAARVAGRSPWDRRLPPWTRDDPDSLHRPVRTYKRRAGRVTVTQRDALDQLWPRFGLVVDGAPLDLPALFGRSAPVVLEIGFGMGEATAALAVAEPERDILAVDVHTPGHGGLLKLLDAADLTNVRVVDGDARPLLESMLASQSLTGVRVFFPDPWPKQRHLKRRLVDDAFADLVADRLVDGGFLHVATDMRRTPSRPGL